MKQAAIILAAGLSSRMREFKPMLHVGGRSMIQRVVDTLRQAGVEHIVVVTGYRAETLQKHLAPLGVVCAHNADFARTHMYDSLKVGLAALPRPCERILVFPVDIPLVSPKTVAALLAVDATTPVCPTHKGRKGHPLLLPGTMIPFLMRYGGEEGLRGAIKASGMRQRLLEVEDRGMLLDANDTDAYYAILKEDTALSGGGRLTFRLEMELIGTEPFFDGGSLQFLELVDKTGSMRTACDCMHLSYTSAWKMLKKMEAQLGAPLLVRTAGGAKGGGSALTRKGKALMEAYGACRDAGREAANTVFERYFGSAMNPSEQRKSRRKRP